MVQRQWLTDTQICTYAPMMYIRTVYHTSSRVHTCTHAHTHINILTELFPAFATGGLVLSTRTHTVTCHRQYTLINHTWSTTKECLLQIRTYTYIHTYIHTYSTYIHTYIHTYIRRCAFKLPTHKPTCFDHHRHLYGVFLSLGICHSQSELVATLLQTT